MMNQNFKNLGLLIYDMYDMFGPTRHWSKFRILVTYDVYDMLDQLLTILNFLGGGG